MILCFKKICDDMTIYMLCDNGSVRPDATLKLRVLAANLSERCGKTIHPVSLMHANRIAAEDINNEPADIFPDFLDQQLSAGERDFTVIPLFFGKSRALTNYIPQKTLDATEKFGPFTLDIKEVLYPLPDGESELVKILIDHIRETASEASQPLRNTVLVDHGSPIPQVTAVREHIAQLIQQSPDIDIDLAQCVMERREGKEYDFNGPLLEDWLIEKARNGEKSAIVAMMFILPGRHAGANGDIVEICESVMQRYPGFKISISPLISEHDSLLDLLTKRLQ